ncbi:MAG: gfo/Idh/MocA family oxidoreductase [Bacteroidota bacterium]|nr:gfo/Idh/MocA family oxidoreductase [Bacteroidota bacterium]
MIWIIGTGLMSREYAKVLKALNKEFIAIGKGEENCALFEKEYSVKTIRGGLNDFLKTKPPIPESVIVGVGIEALTETTIALLNYGIGKILLEKPGVGYASEITAVSELVKEQNAHVLLAYNRRFYSSVIQAQKIIKDDGGVVSFNFEFTEWSHLIRNLKKHKTEHHNWFLGNSTHVIDTAFYLGGNPKELCAFFKGGLDWHPASSVFAGAGVSENNALFSYQANWEGPGRWVIELITPIHRLIFKPMETLQIQNIGSVAVEPVLVDDHLDKEFKPGIYLQTETFIKGDYSRFCSVQDQKNMIEKYYNKMSGY